MAGSFSTVQLLDLGLYDLDLGLDDLFLPIDVNADGESGDRAE